MTDTSIWDLQGEFYWNALTKSQREEIDNLLEDMKVIYSAYRVVRVKQIITKILHAKGTVRGRSTFATAIDEWDLKDFAIIVNDIMEREKVTWEDLEKQYTETEEEIGVALSYIQGVFNNSRIWKGHIDLLRSYKKQLEIGIPLTDRQAETLLNIMRRYSKQIVSNTIL